MPMSPYMAEIRAKIGNQMIEIPAASVLTFDENDRVLLVKHADFEQWTTPGGAIEPEESPADAAVSPAGLRGAPSNGTRPASTFLPETGRIS